MDKYFCQLCNYKTDRRFCLDKHLRSTKHLRNEENLKYQKENESKDMIISTMKTQFDNLHNDIVSLKETINNNRQTTTNSHNTNTTNNTNSHNTFNLQFFLNETCKDAMNITEFVESIEVGIRELKFLGKKGYVEAISSLIINNLNKLDITKRPMHCSDLKRENIYIRTKHAWEKENKEKKVTNNLIEDVQRANTIAVQGKYQDEFPQCMTDYNSKEHKEYGEIVYQAFGGKGDIDDLNKKIIRRIVKEIQIDKSDISI
jgi:hypothetical protein